MAIDDLASLTRSRRIKIGLLTVFTICISSGRISLVHAQTANSFNPASVPVYVGEMELHAVLRPGTQRPETHVTPAPSAANSTLAKPAEDEPPVSQAQFIVQSIHASLLRALAALGYQARPSPAQRAGSGVELRGVFAEPDDKNRIRRAILGAGANAPKLLLYVSVANLAKPAQPFYQRVVPNPAVPEAVDNRYGPVIAISAYVPVSKFEVDRSPAPEDLDKVARAVAAQVDALLRANALAVSRQ